MTHLSSETFDSNAREALKDETLRGALRLATSLFGERRRHAMEEVPNWEDLRERARQIKEATLARLDHHLLQFEGNLLRDGVLVHWARDADEACRVISSIATDQGVKTIVKSKSMTSEEIHLNESLEEGLSGLEKAAKLPFASSLCGACREVCPVKIDIPELLLHLRSEVCGGKGPSGSGRGLGERIGFRLWSWFMSGPRRYRFATRLARLGTSRGLSGRIARSLAPLVDRWTDAREIRPAARRSFRELWRDDQGGKDR